MARQERNGTKLAHVAMPVTCYSGAELHPIGNKVVHDACARVGRAARPNSQAWPWGDGPTNIRGDG